MAGGLKIKIALALALLLVLAGGVRVAVILERKLSEVNPDELIFGLMALHILEGREIPVFFWAQPYLGTLEAWLAAGFFRLGGCSLFMLQLAPLTFALGFVLTTFFLGRSLFGEEAGLWAGLLAALPPAFFVLWSVKSSGNIETPFFGQVVLLLAIPFLRPTPPPRRLFIWLGLFTGFAFWAAHACIVFIIAALTLLLIHSPSSRRGLIRSVPFMPVGAAPLVIYNLLHSGATFVYLAKSFAGIGKEVYRVDGAGGYLVAVLKRRFLISFPNLAHNLAQIFSCHVPGWLERVNFFLWAAALTCALAWKVQEKVRTGFRVVPSDLLFVTFLVSLFLGYSGRDIPRHFLPLYGVVPVLAASLIRAWRKVNARLILWPLVFFDLTGVLFLREGFRLRPDFWQPLLREVRGLGIRRGYADFDTAYKLNFITGEEVVFSPALLPGSERYPPYTSLVDQAGNPAYLLPRQREKVAAFESYLRTAGISFQRKLSPQHIIYTSLSRPLRSRELGGIFGNSGFRGRGAGNGHPGRSE